MMDIRARTDECVVLRGRDFGDADRILVLLFREYGKMSCIAKGVRRPKSRLKASTQLFSYSRVTFSAGRSNLAVVTQGEAIDSLPALRDDLTAIACASYIGEMLDVVLPEGKPQENIFILAVTTLTLLAGMADPFLVLKYFELRLLAELGYRPNLERCLCCGRRVDAVKFYLDPLRGGLVCRGCNAGNRQTAELSAGSVMMLERLLRWDLRQIFNLRISEDARREMDNAVSLWLDYHLGAAASRARDNLSLYWQP